jgi:hypothetical protein
MMPGLTKKLLEIENNIKRQNALKLLRADHKPIDASLDALENAYSTIESKDNDYPDFHSQFHPYTLG